MKIAEEIIKKYSDTPGLDLIRNVFLRVIGSYIMGNSDMHLKNFSLEETEPGNRIFQIVKGLRYVASKCNYARRSGTACAYHK